MTASAAESLALLPPGLILILGALVLPFLRGRVQAALTLLLPLVSFAHLSLLSDGSTTNLEALGASLTVVRVDRLSLIFGIVFHIAAVLSALYALHVRDTTQHVSAMVYVGSAVGAVFAGDLVTLFIYWELTAVSSVFLIWASRSECATRAGLRYLVIQVGSGVLLLAGVVLHYRATGSLEFTRLIGEDGSLATAGPGVLLILAAFGIKCAFPLMHNWLQDAYPKATVTGTVFLSAFTTKLAVYTLVRGFPGTEALIGIGVVMTLFPIFFAVIENDLRKVLAYSLNNQLGFMVVGVGVGTELALNGAVAHAFVHIIYKGLLFMSMGAVLYRTQTSKASELGGLYRSMPLTAACCVVGAMSISAFPLFSGFVAKSLTLSAVAEGHHVWVWLGLLAASAGVMEHSGIKIPFFSFFGHDSGIRCKEAPVHMLLAMGIAAFLCIAIGCYPTPLYTLLPFEVDYAPYADLGHCLTQLQLLLFAALAFGFLMRTRLYPPEVPSVNLDSDWIYRRWLPRIVRAVGGVGAEASAALGALAGRWLALALRGVHLLHGPRGVLARTWSTGGIALWAILCLFGYLLLAFTR
ncbi:MAG: Na(+)/H(+) antiporter subunit D [Planctomycetes bacterium]|jgi:multicomponent Na+:H+ antiporter subunit D|nr:Na(+)/H(+) antiporter subunit D [Planctomycetota bacterium]MDP6409154.1 Na(+)/H(+) antiporter subunit D [Planctomycetota bacterium]